MHDQTHQVNVSVFVSGGIDIRLHLGLDPQISPTDQARLDAIEARAKKIAAKLTALDKQTPPATKP